VYFAKTLGFEVVVDKRENINIMVEYTLSTSYKQKKIS